MNYLFFQIDKGMKEEPTKRISYGYPSGSRGTTTSFLVPKIFPIIPPKFSLYTKSTGQPTFDKP